MNKAERQELSRQLRCPSGERGAAVAAKMAQANAGMLTRSVAALALAGREQLLEVGHGGAAHLPLLLGGRPQLFYSGLEISAVAHAEGEAAARRYGWARQTSWQLYPGGAVLPYPSAAFDRLLTANTLYFWPEPAAFLAELTRVLRPGGLLTVTFMPRHYMQTLPFVGSDFALYEADEVAELARDLPLKLLKCPTFYEPLEIKPGLWRQRPYCVATFQLN